MRKTVVFFSLDGFGHINPMLAIADQVKQRGHKIIFLTFRPIPWSARIESLGLQLEHCIPEGHEENANDFVKLFIRMMTPDPIESMKNFFSDDGFIYRYMTDVGKHRDTVCAKLNSFEPDLVLVDQFLATSCWPKITCPWVGLYPACALGIFSAYSEKLVAEFGLKLEEMTPEMKKLEREYKSATLQVTRDIWRDHGITSWPGDIEAAVVSPFLNFYLGPRELGYELIPGFENLLPDCWFRLEHTLEDNEHTNNFKVPEKLRDLPGKLIYFSLGTIVSGSHELHDRLFKVLAKSPNKFIVSLGQDAGQAELAPNMWGDKFLDQKAILAEADMFITHGGHNSTIEAFYYGVPSLIVMPCFADQFDIAQRVEDCGFGVRINPFTCTEEELLGAIEKHLANHEIKQKMKAISSRLKSINYPQIAADKLEELLKIGKSDGYDSNGNNNS